MPNHRIRPLFTAVFIDERLVESVHSVAKRRQLLLQASAIQPPQQREEILGIRSFPGFQYLVYKLRNILEALQKMFDFVLSDGVEGVYAGGGEDFLRAEAAEVTPLVGIRESHQGGVVVAYVLPGEGVRPIGENGVVARAVAGMNPPLKTWSSLSLGGRVSLISSQLMKSSFQRHKLGNFSFVTISTPTASSRTPTQNATKLPAISANPIVSPPKNFFVSNSLSRIFRSSQASSFPFSCSSSFANRAFVNAGMHYMNPTTSKLSPETSQSSVIRVLRQNGSAWKGLINVFNNDKRFCKWFSIVQEHRDFLVDWVVLEKQGALVGEVFFYQFILNSFQSESHLNPAAKWASPTA
nr:unnamed protein product [Ipomoea batatas]